METASEQVDESRVKLEKPSILLQTEIKSWWIGRVMKPLEDFFVRNHVSPNAITLGGLGIFFICFLLYARGHILFAGWMVWLGGSLDVLDGRVARATGSVTQAGAFLDSVIDRYQDICLFAGLAVFYRHTWILYVVLLGLTGTMLVSYTRSKAQNVNVDLEKIGAMQRPERIFLLGFGSVIGSVFQISLMPFYGKGNFPPQHILILTLVILAIATNMTAIRRIRHTMKELGDEK